MSQRSPNCGEAFALILTLSLVGGIAWGVHRANESRHTVDFAHFQVDEIRSTSAGYIALVTGDARGFAIRLTVDQANSLKPRDIIDFTLEFNGWGSYQRTVWLIKRN